MSQVTTLHDFKFPKEIKNLISSLKNEKQWMILEFLVQNNNKLSYTKLKNKLGISNDEKSKLTYHLKELVKSGWLRNQINPNIGISKEQSFYIINDFGLKMINSAVKTLDVQSYDQNIWQEFVDSAQLVKNKNNIVLPSSIPSKISSNELSFTFTTTKQSFGSAMSLMEIKQRLKNPTASG